MTYCGESTTQLPDRLSFNWFHTSCEVLQISHTPWKSNKQSFLSGRRAKLFFWPWIMAVCVGPASGVVCWFIDGTASIASFEMPRWMLELDVQCWCQKVASQNLRWKNTPTDSSGRSTHREWSCHEAWHGQGDWIWSFGHHEGLLDQTWYLLKLLSRRMSFSDAWVHGTP